MKKRMLTIDEPLQSGQWIERLDGYRVMVKRNWYHWGGVYGEWRLAIGGDGWETYLSPEQIEAGLWLIYTH